MSSHRDPITTQLWTWNTVSESRRKPKAAIVALGALKVGVAKENEALAIGCDGGGHFVLAGRDVRVRGVGKGSRECALEGEAMCTRDDDEPSG